MIWPWSRQLHSTKTKSAAWQSTASNCEFTAVLFLLLEKYFKFVWQVDKLKLELHCGGSENNPEAGKLHSTLFLASCKSNLNVSRDYTHCILEKYINCNWGPPLWTIVWAWLKRHGLIKIPGSVESVTKHINSRQQIVKNTLKAKSCIPKTSEMLSTNYSDINNNLKCTCKIKIFESAFVSVKGWGRIHVMFLVCNTKQLHEWKHRFILFSIKKMLEFVNIKKDQFFKWKPLLFSQTKAVCTVVGVSKCSSQWFPTGGPQIPFQPLGTVTPRVGKKMK